MSRSPGERIECDIAVVGGGSGGLSVAAGAARMGARVVLVERGRMGGECLNFGCVPSKALLAAGHAARDHRVSTPFGVEADEPRIGFARVHEHVHAVIGEIAPHDSVERFQSLGVTVLLAEGRFEGPETLVAGETRIEARWIVLATGSSPALPPIPGLDTVPVLTNESIFDLTEPPERLLVIGGGPIGAELAQAHRRLGVPVVVLEALSLLPRDDPEAAAVVRSALLGEGVELREGAEVRRVGPGGRGGVEVLVGLKEGGEEVVRGSHLLVAAGRRPNLEALALDRAGIRHTRAGIEVDHRLRTSNRRVYAIGDVAGGPQFTHAAGYQAGVVLRNALFRIPARVDHRAVPRVTYTDPELAQVGLTEEEARTRHGDRVRVHVAPFAGNDRARTERRTEGFVKAVFGPRGRILGATLVGAGAGEQVGLWCLALSRGMRAGHLAGLVLPYPTRSEAAKQAAGAYFADTLFGPRTRRLVRLIARLLP